MAHGHLRTGVRLGTIAIAATMLVALAQGPATAGGRGVRAVTVADGLNGSAAFTFTPKGTIVYLERGTGEVRFLNPKTDFDRRFFDIKAVRSDGERGALGVALHPNWPRKPFVYVYVTRSIDGNIRNQILRIRERNGRGVGFTTILSSPSPAGNHNGGRIAFGPDGKL